MNLDALYIRVTKVISGYRFSWHSEKDLQDGLERVFREHGILLSRERYLGVGSVADFLLWDETLDVTNPSPAMLVEVKVGGSLSDLTRQLSRYAGFDDVAGLLVVTTRSSLARLPASLQGKPVRSIVVGGAF